MESLPKVIEEAIALSMAGTGGRIRLETGFSPEAEMAFIDRVQIQQVLFNIIRNAIEAMEDSSKRELLISTGVEGDRISLNIADSGAGLPELVRSRLFEPFVTTKQNGMGVGLSICRTIIEAHGGELTARDNPKGGTTFTMTLPRVTAEAAPGSGRPF